MKIGLSIVISGTMLASHASAQGAPGKASASTGKATTHVGNVVAQDGKFLLTNDASKAIFELRGDSLGKWAGMKVRVRGAVQAAAGSGPGAPQVLVVSSVTRIGPAAAAGGTAAAAGVKAGLSKAVVAAVGAGAAAATTGALVASEVIGGGEENVSRQ